MAEAPFWPVATDALIADTTHLSPEEFGAYVKLMIAQWRNGGEPLPDDPVKLSRMAGGFSKAKWIKVWDVISMLFVVENGLVSQERVSKDFIKVSEKIEKKSANGKKGGRPKSLKINKLVKAKGYVSLKLNESKPKATINHKPEDIESITNVIPKSSLFDDDENGVENDKPKKPKPRKCQITKILKSSDEIPDEYHQYAAEHGIRNISELFKKWHEWWDAEAGLKAGEKGWLLTWQGRVRKEQGQQGNHSASSQGSQRNSTSSTLDAARAVLDRRRNQERGE